MYCIQCGTKLPDDAKFCYNCGAKIDIASEPAEESPVQQKKTDSRKSRKKWIIMGACILCALVVLSVVVLPHFIGGSENIKETEPELNYDELSKSVLKLECYSAAGELYCTGSGVVVIDSQTVATNLHVISGDCYTIKAIADDGQEAQVTHVIAYSEEKDLALLKLENPTNITPLEIETSLAPQRGDEVIAIGSPLGLLNTVSNGIISGFFEDGEINAIQTTAAISAGSSGGALINKDGKLIGITYSGMQNGQNLNFAIPAEEILSLSENSINRTLHDFYFLIEHQLDLDYILNNIANNNVLSKIKIRTTGYISTICHYQNNNGRSVYIVSNKSDVLYGDFYIDSNSRLYRTEPIIHSEVDRYNSYGSVHASAGLGKAGSINPGDFVEIVGKFSYSEFYYSEALLQIIYPNEKKEPYTTKSVDIDVVSEITVT